MRFYSFCNKRLPINYSRKEVVCQPFLRHSCDGRSFPAVSDLVCAGRENHCRAFFSTDVFRFVRSVSARGYGVCRLFGLFVEFVWIIWFVCWKYVFVWVGVVMGWWKTQKNKGEQNKTQSNRCEILGNLNNKSHINFSKTTNVTSGSLQAVRFWYNLIKGQTDLI